MRLKVEPITVIFLALWAASVTGGFFAGRATRPSEITTNQIDASTNVFITHSYAVSLSSSTSASVAVALPQSNINIVFDYDFTNVVFSLTNDETN